MAGESWLRRAALAGDARAATLVAKLYVQSGPLPPNYAEAATWYRRAAEAGDRAAARALGSLYLTGAGVPRDSEEAACWLRSSAEAGDRAAQADLPTSCSREQPLLRTRSKLPDGSSRLLRLLISSLPSTSAYAWSTGSVLTKTSCRQRNGCAARLMEYPTPNICTAACLPRDAASHLM